MQLKHPRFINLHGHTGSNVPCDLHMEHLNKMVKLCVHHLAANKMEKSIERIGKSISPIYEALCAFDDENLISNASGKHSVPSRKEDQNEIIKELLQNDIFEFKPGREHKHFKGFSCNIMKSVDYLKTIIWMKERYDKIINEIALRNQ